MDLLLCVLGFVFVFPFLVASDELVVVGDSRAINLTPIVEVKGSPGLNPEVITLCERIHIYGFGSRYEHFYKYPISLKLTLQTSTSDDIHVCFHIISSRPIGMCPHNRWKKVSNGTLIERSTPFGHQIMDVRVANWSSKRVPLIKVSAEEEWFMHRIVCLIFGTTLLSLTNLLRGRCLAFYISMSVIAGYLLTILLFLFQVFQRFFFILCVFVNMCSEFQQGIKRLPTRLNISALSMYSFLIVLSSILYHCIPGWYRSMLIVIGYCLEKDAPCFFLFGGVCGFYATNVFAWTRDGSIDRSTFLFVSWSIWILAAVLILQGSSDIFLGGGALVSVIVVTRLICLLGLNEILMNFLQRIWEVIHDATEPTVSKHMQWINEQGMKRMRERALCHCDVCRRMRDEHSLL